MVAGVTSVDDASAFSAWAGQWLALGSYTGADLSDVDERIEQAVALWHQPIPRGWERADDPEMLDGSRRYRRNHAGRPDGPVGEAFIEQAVLGPDPTQHTTTVLGGRLLDGI